MIQTHYPAYDSECPPDTATLGAVYNELRNDAIRLDCHISGLRNLVGRIAAGESLALEAGLLLASLDNSNAKLHCKIPTKHEDRT